MPTQMIKPNGYLKVRYKVPRRGLIEYTVEADRPVDTFVLDQEGLLEFEDRAESVYSYYGGFARRREHHQELRLPPNVRAEGFWYLVINNRNNESAAVHYEVLA